MSDGMESWHSAAITACTSVVFELTSIQSYKGSDKLLQGKCSMCTYMSVKFIGCMLSSMLNALSLQVKHRMHQSQASSAYAMPSLIVRQSCSLCKG